MAVRPSLANDSTRLIGPGLDPRPEQPKPHPTGNEHRGQLEQPVRQDQAEEQRAPVVAEHQRGRDADVDHVGADQQQHRQAEHPEGDAQRRHLGVVDPHQGSELAVRELGVVVLEVGADVRLDLGRRHLAGPHLGVADRPPGDEGGQGHAHQGRGPPPPPGAVERRREGAGEEAQEVGPRRGAGSRRGTAGPSQQGREVGDHRRVGAGRAHHRQVGRDPLVEVEQLVGLGSGEAAPGGQLLEPLPLRPVGHEVSVEVHPGSLTADDRASVRVSIPG